VPRQLGRGEVAPGAPRAAWGRAAQAERLQNEKQDGAQAAAAGEVKSAAKEPTFDNRRARYEYEKLESLEVGVALSGTEIKSVRNGNLSLNEGFARVRDGELWLVNFTILHIRSEHLQPRAGPAAQVAAAQRAAGAIDRSRGGKGPDADPVALVLQARPGEARTRFDARQENLGQAPHDRDRDAKRDLERATS